MLHMKLSPNCLILQSKLIKMAIILECCLKQNGYKLSNMKNIELNITNKK